MEWLGAGERGAAVLHSEKASQWGAGAADRHRGLLGGMAGAGVLVPRFRFRAFPGRALAAWAAVGALACSAAQGSILAAFCGSTAGTRCIPCGCWGGSRPAWTALPARSFCCWRRPFCCCSAFIAPADRGWKPGRGNRTAAGRVKTDPESKPFPPPPIPAHPKCGGGEQLALPAGQNCAAAAGRGKEPAGGTPQAWERKRRGIGKQSFSVGSGHQPFSIKTARKTRPFPAICRQGRVFLGEA